MIGTAVVAVAVWEGGKWIWNRWNPNYKEKEKVIYEKAFNDGYYKGRSEASAEHEEYEKKLQRKADELEKELVEYLNSYEEILNQNDQLKNERDQLKNKLQSREKGLKEKTRKWLFEFDGFNKGCDESQKKAILRLHFLQKRILSKGCWNLFKV